MLKNRYAAVGAALAAVAGGATGLAATAADAATAHPASAAVLKLASVKVSVGSTNKSYKVLVNAKVGVWHHNHMNQVTLNGHPLYTFVQDIAGSASGEGMKSFGGVWELLNSSGSGMKKPSSSGGGGGGGY